MQHKVGARWRVAATRVDDGEHVGFGVYDAQDGSIPRLVSIADEEARATHVAHALESFDAHGLGRQVPLRVFIKRAERGRLQ